jgi:hypothetical protein
MLLALEPALRLALLEVLSQAAAEITAELPTGVVEVCLRGREPELLVDVPTPSAVPPGGPTPAADLPRAGEDDGAVARVTLRIPESVKGRAEALAAEAGVSLNTWVVNVLRAATGRTAAPPDLDLTSIPVPGSPAFGAGRRIKGWV